MDGRGRFGTGVSSVAVTWHLSPWANLIGQACHELRVPCASCAGLSVFGRDINPLQRISPLFACCIGFGKQWKGGKDMRGNGDAFLLVLSACDQDRGQIGLSQVINKTGEPDAPGRMTQSRSIKVPDCPSTGQEILLISTFPVPSTCGTQASTISPASKGRSSLGRRLARRGGASRLARARSRLVRAIWADSSDPSATTKPVGAWSAIGSGVLAITGSRHRSKQCSAVRSLSRDTRTLPQNLPEASSN